MPREVDVSLNELNFVLRALDENTRLDGRSLEETRQPEITFGDESGVADVRLGKTRVLAHVSAEVTQPFPDRRFDGIFNIVTELSPMVSPAFETGRPTEIEVLLSRLLEKAIRRSNALDTESLCILARQKCWAVRADVHVLDYDGGLVDASCMAVMAALQHFRRSDVSVEGEQVTIHTAEERVPVPLSLLHYPFCTTISFFREGQVLVVDATLRESKVSEGEVIVTANQQGEVCQIAKLGGVPADAVLLLKCVELATEKTAQLSSIVAEAVKKDEDKRNKGGILAELTAENER